MTAFSDPNNEFWTRKCSICKKHLGGHTDHRKCAEIKKTCYEKKKKPAAKNSKRTYSKSNLDYMVNRYR